jgi:hypothetical protein
MRLRKFRLMPMSGGGPSLPISNFRLDGQFRRDSGLVLLTMSFVDFDPKETSTAVHLVHAR